jgi:molecular chaperone DnaK
MATNYLGIDLGTTETTVSVIEIESRRDKPIEKLRTLDIYQYDKNHNFERNIKGLQSSIYIDRENRKVYLGEYAKNFYSSGNFPLNTVRSVKTRIGGESMIDVPKGEERESYNMTELSALFLKSVKKSVEKQTSGGVKTVTVTIPAGFNSDERNATLDAIHLAGFKDVHLLDEPTAVLLDFLNSEDDVGEIDEDFFEEKRKVLVYDIGGGTLDISIAEVEDDGDFQIDILGRSKRVDFGGDDIDKYISAYFLDEFQKVNSSIDTRTPEEQFQIVSRIVSNAEKHKIAFNNQVEKVSERRRKRVKESVNFEIIDGLKISDLLLTDEKLKEILAPLLSENGYLLKPLKESLKSAKVKDVDLVLLTGGSGKFYLVREAIEKFFSGVPVVDYTYSNAVSKGATIHSFNQHNETLKKVELKDVMSDDIYIKREKGFEKLISHETQAGESGIYKFIFDEVSERLDVFLFYGSENEEKWKYREINGVFHTLDRIYKKGESIDLEWKFDENKIVKLFLNGSELLNSDVQKHLQDKLKDFEIN